MGKVKIQLTGICPVCFRHLDNSGHWKNNDEKLEQKAKEFIASGEEENGDFYRDICTACVHKDEPKSSSCKCIEK